MKKPVMVNDKFGRLKVVSRDLSRKGYYFICECSCGTSKSVYGSSLKRGATRSCGCLLAQVVSMPKTHGAATGGKLSREYRSWKAMKERCQNPNHTHFKNYGGRGITVCERWSSFEIFLSDMGARPKGYSLDRGNSNGDYTPENCRWASRATQNKNAKHVVQVMRSDGAAFASLSDGARSVGGSAPAISRAIKLNRKHKGFRWSAIHESKADVLGWGEEMLGVK